MYVGGHLLGIKIRLSDTVKKPLSLCLNKLSQTKKNDIS